MWVSLGSSCLRLLCFLDLYVFFLHQITEVFSAIIFSIAFSIPCSLSFPSDIPVMQILLCLMLSQKSLKLSSFWGFFFLFAILIGSFLLPCLSNLWFDPLLHLNCCWFLLGYSSYQSLYSSFLTGSFLWFLCPFLSLQSLCWSSHWVHLFSTYVPGPQFWVLPWGFLGLEGAPLNDQPLVNFLREGVIFDLPLNSQNL